MAGNAAEEGLMQQLGNPSHVDTGRIVVPAAALSGYASGYLVWRLIPSVTVWTALIVGVIVCGLVARRLARWFSARKLARETADREAIRAEQIADTKRKVSAMQFRNDPS